jgi:hypothetical protein
VACVPGSARPHHAAARGRNSGENTSPCRHDAIVQLNETGGVLRMSELAYRLLLHRSATIRFAERLERARLSAPR